MGFGEEGRSFSWRVGVGCSGNGQGIFLARAAPGDGRSVSRGA